MKYFGKDLIMSHQKQRWSKICSDLRVSGLTTTVKIEDQYYTITKLQIHYATCILDRSEMISSPSFTSSPDPTSQNSRLKECIDQC